MVFAEVLVFILTRAFSFIFQASKETAQSAGGDLLRVFSAIKETGSHQLKEFLATVPVFIEFFLHLMKERDKLEKSKQLLMIGAAAALSSLVGFLIVSVLGSWTVQVALIIAFPLLGVPLFLATGVAITTIVVLFVWLVMFVLNKALADDPAYQNIREGYLPASARKMLSDIEAKVHESHTVGVTEAAETPDVMQFYQLIETQLRERGQNADAAQVTKKLEKIQSKLSKENGRLKKQLLKTAARVEKIENSTSS